MWLSLMLCAEGGNPWVSSEPSGFLLMEESSGDVQSDSNEEAEAESVEDKNSLLRQYWTHSVLRQYWNRSQYGHPDFERAQRLTTVGTRTQVVGGALVVGGGVLALASLFNTITCSGPDCGGNGIVNGVLVASLGATGCSVGLGLSSLGSFAARDILRAKGVDVSNAGLMISTVGMGVAALGSRWYISQAPEEMGGWVAPVVLGSYVAIPIGLLVQQRINKKAYMGFVGEASLAPIWTPDTTGAVVQFQF